jgi:hypothetical protein
MSDEKLNEVVAALEKEGISPQDSVNTEGIGDKVSNILNSFGVTPELMQKWLGIKECGCKKRQKFLNGVLSFMKGK